MPLSMEDIWKFIVPLGLLGFIVGYHKLANRLKVPRPIYWMTMIAAGFLVMSVFDVW